MKSLINRVNSVLTIIFFSIVLPSIAQVNQHPNLCPHSATYSKTGGLKNFWTEHQTKVKTTGKKILSQNSNCNDLLTVATPDKPLVLGFDYIFAKTEKVPAMDYKGRLDYDNQFDASYLLRYKSDKEPLEKTWWFHEYNDPNKEILSYSEGLMDIYKKELDFRLTRRADISTDLSSKKFVFAEYSGVLKNKADFCFTNTLFVKNGLIKSTGEYESLVKFFNGFTEKFDNIQDIQIQNRVFVVTVKSKTSKYVAVFKLENRKLQGELQLLNAATKATILKSLDNTLAEGVRQIG